MKPVKVEASPNASPPTEVQTTEVKTSVINFPAVPDSSSDTTENAKEGLLGPVSTKDVSPTDTVTETAAEKLLPSSIFAESVPFEGIADEQAIATELLENQGIWGFVTQLGADHALSESSKNALKSYLLNEYSLDCSDGNSDTLYCPEASGTSLLALAHLESETFSNTDSSAILEVQQGVNDSVTIDNGLSIYTSIAQEDTTLTVSTELLPEQVDATEVTFALSTADTDSIVFTVGSTVSAPIPTAFCDAKRRDCIRTMEVDFARNLGSPAVSACGLSFLKGVWPSYIVGEPYENGVGGSTIYPQTLDVSQQRLDSFYAGSALCGDPIISNVNALGYTRAVDIFNEDFARCDRAQRKCISDFYAGRDTGS